MEERKKEKKRMSEKAVNKIVLFSKEIKLFQNWRKTVVKSLKNEVRIPQPGNK